MYGPLSNTLLSLQQVIHFFFEHLVLKTLLTSVGIVSYKRLFLINHNINQINHNHIYVNAIVKFSNRPIQNLFNINLRTCMDSCKLYYFIGLARYYYAVDVVAKRAANRSCPTSRIEVVSNFKLVAGKYI